MRTPAELYAQIEARREELSLSQAQLAERAFGSSSSSPLQNIRRGSLPSVDRLAAIADAIDYELYFGPKRETGPVATIEPDDAKFAHIPLHSAQLAAGDGITAGEEVVDHLAFRRDWLQRVGVTASAARLAHVTGESMTPTLFPGDLVMIDTSIIVPAPLKRSPKDHRRSPIYAFADGSGARIKRIERPTEDQLMLLSDNPDYPPELHTGCDIAELKIIGKVVWWGHIAKE